MHDIAEYKQALSFAFCEVISSSPSTHNTYPKKPVERYSFVPTATQARPPTALHPALRSESVTSRASTPDLDFECDTPDSVESYSTKTWTVDLLQPISPCSQSFTSECISSMGLKHDSFESLSDSNWNIEHLRNISISSATSNTSSSACSLSSMEGNYDTPKRGRRSSSKRWSISRLHPLTIFTKLSRPESPSTTGYAYDSMSSAGRPRSRWTIGRDYNSMSPGANPHAY